MAHSPEEIRRHVRFYIGVFIALAALTVVTVAISGVHIGPPDSNAGNIAVGLLIAALKAGLVAAFFMHLSAEKPLVYRILIGTVIFVIGLFVLTFMAFQDEIRPLF